MEITEEKSLDQAAIIKVINAYITRLDVEYLTEVAEQLRNQARRQDAMLVLSNDRTQVTKNKILFEKYNALYLLTQYIKTLMQVEKLNSSLADQAKQECEINKLFI